MGGCASVPVSQSVGASTRGLKSAIRKEDEQLQHEGHSKPHRAIKSLKPEGSTLVASPAGEGPFAYEDVISAGKHATQTAKRDQCAEIRNLATANSIGSVNSGISLQATPTEESKVMLQDSLQQLMQLPYSVFASGPYTPACDKERVAYANRLNLIGSQPDAQIGRILTSVAGVFNTSTVLLTLCGEQRVWIRNAIGFSVGHFDWRWSFCGWSLAPPTPTVLVIQDTHEDARFRDNVGVTGKPHIRHFAGAPLVASNHHRLGTLCFLGDQPRKFTAEEMVILTNLAELVVRELEKQAACKSGTAFALSDNVSTPSQTVRRSDRAGIAAVTVAPMYMSRSVHCFTNQSVLFLDTQPRLWRTLYSNSALCEQTGLTYEAVLDVPFWQLFEPPYEIDGEAWEATQELAQRGGDFIVRGCIIGGRPERGRYSLNFRPADRSMLDADTQPVGVPSDIPSTPGASGRYYFCILSAASMCSQPSFSLDDPLAAVLPTRAALEVPIRELTLGTLLGKGSFGHVYRGVYKGRPVAVKVCTGALTASRGKRIKPWAGVEAVTALKLDHPHIVHTLKHTSVLLQEGNIVSKHTDGGSPCESAISGWDNEWFDEDDPHNPSFSGTSGGRGTGSSGFGSGSGVRLKSGSGTMVEMQTWAILEYCDCGTLQGGIDRGLFRKDRTCKTPSEPELRLVVSIASQLASAITYLHAHGIIHGDLAGGNVLMLKDSKQPHGLSCKVSDFGLSRDLRMTAMLKTKTYGTVTHMPPELLRSGVLGREADSYAFGTLLWEMCHGVRAHSGLTHTQVLAAVAIDHKKLAFAPNMNPHIAALGMQCMSVDPQDRPTFPQIEEELAKLRHLTRLPGGKTSGRH